MSLKPDRVELFTVIDWHMNEVASPGGIASIASGSTGSGVAMDDDTHMVSYVANGSGAKPVGVLLQPMVNVDETKYELNPYTNEVNLGGKVGLLKIGYVVTDMIYSGCTPAAGDTAYVHNSGKYTSVAFAGSQSVGKFDTGKDEDGYARITVNIP